MASSRYDQPEGVVVSRAGLQELRGDIEELWRTIEKLNAIWIANREDPRWMVIQKARQEIGAVRGKCGELM